MELAGRTAVVTGSSSGIGRALAVEFGRQGANVVCCARRQEKLEETADMVRQQGSEALVVPTDVTVRDDVQDMVQAALERFGAIDVLFNNAGRFASIAGVWEADPDDWWEDVRVNLFGSMLCMREVLPHMMERDEGIIISMNGGRPTGGSGYASGKAGLMELSRVLVKELESVDSSVMVFTAGPGLVHTEMTEYQARSEAGQRWIPSTKEHIEAGKTREPEELARATMKMIDIATPQLSGASYNPATDFEELQREAQGN
jgi:NAD(P)-dependent dehydrogenase (short-subunit alcohol dehydrogenase family)